MMYIRAVDDLAARVRECILRGVRLLICTTSTLNRESLIGYNFDVTIVDEAGQVRRRQSVLASVCAGGRHPVSAICTSVRCTVLDSVCR